MTENLTGSWRGVFSYPDDLKPVAFEAELREHGGHFSGVIHEVDDDGRGLMHFTAIVEGIRHGREMDFRKTYDDMPAICIVDYVGSLDPDGQQVTGEWVRLNDLASGSFAMQRQRKLTARAVRKLEAQVPLDR